MAVIYIILPLVLIIVVVAVLAFLWALRDGQFDDLDTPQYRVLFDDGETPPSSNIEKTKVNSELTTKKD